MDDQQLAHEHDGHERDAHHRALDADERFTGDHWAPGPLDRPLLKDVPAWMLCRIIGRYPVEESAVVVVRVEDGSLGEPDVPLLYHEREYWAPGDRA